MTVAHLAAHASGIPPDDFDPKLGAVAEAYAVVRDRPELQVLGDLVRRARARVRARDPSRVDVGGTLSLIHSPWTG